MRSALTLLAFAVAGYALVALLAWRYQGRLVFYPNEPTRQIEATPAEAGLRYEDVELITSDGIALHGWWIPASRREALLFFHGNAGNISHRLESLRLFNSLGLNVLIIDYRGYGRSDGRPSEQGTYMDAMAAWQYMLQVRRLDPAQVVVFGRSLGGAIATELATRVQPAGLILESSFTSIPDMARHAFPWLPSSLATIRYDTLARIGAVTCPVLIMHSPADDVIPFAHAQRLVTAAPAGTRLIELSGAHNDAFLASGASYTAALRDFLAQVFRAQ